MPAHSCDLIPVPPSNIQAQQMDCAAPSLSFPEARRVRPTITNQFSEAATAKTEEVGCDFPCLFISSVARCYKMPRL